MPSNHCCKAVSCDAAQCMLNGVAVYLAGTGLSVPAPSPAATSPAPLAGKLSGSGESAHTVVRKKAMNDGILLNVISVMFCYAKSQFEVPQRRIAAPSERATICAGGGFVPQDVYRLKVGVENAASASYTDSLVSLAALLPCP